MSHYCIETGRDRQIDYLFIPGCIIESEYDQFVTDLEAKARELWPEKFVEMSGNGHFWETNGGTLKRVEFVNVEREDGLTDTITLEEAKWMDLKFREQQVPINSRR